MTERTIRIIGAPMDLGQSRRGVDKGPSAMRYSGLQGRFERLSYGPHNIGNVQVLNPEEEIAEGQARRLRAVATSNQAIYDSCVVDGDFGICLKAITASVSIPSGPRRRQSGQASYGVMRTRTSIRPRAGQAVTFTACRWHLPR